MSVMRAMSARSVGAAAASAMRGGFGAGGAARFLWTGKVAQSIGGGDAPTAGEGDVADRLVKEAGNANLKPEEKIKLLEKAAALGSHAAAHSAAAMYVRGQVKDDKGMNRYAWARWTPRHARSPRVP